MVLKGCGFTFGGQARGVCARCSCEQSTGKKALYWPSMKCQKIKEAAFLKAKGMLYSCLTCFPSGSRLLNWHLHLFTATYYLVAIETYVYMEVQVGFVPLPIVSFPSCLLVGWVWGYSCYTWSHLFAANVSPGPEHTSSITPKLNISIYKKNLWNCSKIFCYMNHIKICDNYIKKKIMW